MAALAKATTLTHHDPTTSLRLITDASNIACAAVLEQVLEGSPTPAGLLQSQVNTARDPLQCI